MFYKSGAKIQKKSGIHKFICDFTEDLLILIQKH